MLNSRLFWKNGKEEPRSNGRLERFISLICIIFAVILSGEKKIKVPAKYSPPDNQYADKDGKTGWEEIDGTPQTKKTNFQKREEAEIYARMGTSSMGEAIEDFGTILAQKSFPIVGILLLCAIFCILWPQILRASILASVWLTSPDNRIIIVVTMVIIFFVISESDMVIKTLKEKYRLRLEEEKYNDDTFEDEIARVLCIAIIAVACICLALAIGIIGGVAWAIWHWWPEISIYIVDHAGDMWGFR